MKFTKQTAKENGAKGGKMTHKIYGSGYMLALAKKRWVVDKSLLHKGASGDKVKRYEKMFKMQ